MVEVDFANRDDDNECHIFDVAGNHVGFAHLGGTFAGSSLSRISEVVGHPDQALVTRALASRYRDGSSFFKVLGIAHLPNQIPILNYSTGAPDLFTMMVRHHITVW